MLGSLKHTYDIAIVGGGPAGSSAAIRLANAGLSVLLCEQKRFPREKLCGEFISPECLAHFAELGVMPEITAARGSDVAETVFFSRSGKGVTVPSTWFGNAASPALGLSRSHMDALLVGRASDSGVEVHQETAGVGLLFHEKKVIGLTLRTRDGAKNDVNAKLTIDATGRNRSLARLLETKDVQKKPASHVAFKTHLSGASLNPAACEIYAYRDGYGGCNEVENGLYNLCFIVSAKDTKRVGSDPERLLREVVFQNERAREALADAKVAAPWLAVPIERYGRGELVPASGLLTIGDAAAFIDPFTGSGILLALESARIVSDVIAQGVTAGHDFDRIANEYARRYGSSFNARLRVCSILRYATSAPILAEAAISLLGFSGTLRRRIATATRFSAAPDA